MGAIENKTVTPSPGSNDQNVIENLKRQETRHWYMLAAISMISTVGLSFAIFPMLTGRISDLWPWANTNIVLLGGLLTAVGLLVWYLTMQQRKTRRIRNQVQAMLEESTKHKRQNAARLHALLNVSRMMGSVTNLENVFNSITNTCLEIFDCQQSSLMMVNDQTGQLETRSVTGHLNPDKVLNSTQKVGEGIAGWVAQQKEPLILTKSTDITKYPDLELKNMAISAAMVVPILLRDELVGVLNISSRSPDVDYSEEDLQALQVFAENAGACIRHTEHVEWMRKTIQNLNLKTGQHTVKTGVHKSPDPKVEA